jgi:hypothetical protein
VLREAQCFPRFVFSQSTADLEHDATGFYHGYPEFYVTLAFTHTGFGWFLGNGFVWKDADPHFAPALQGVHDRPAGSFDLAGGNPARLECLQAEITEVDLDPTQLGTFHPAAHLFSVLDSLWH